MENYIINPLEIERKSFEIIESEMNNTNLPELRLSIMKRVIHTTTDFVYEDILLFKEDVEYKMLEAIKGGCTIITDTNMIKSGISKALCKKLGVTVECFVADEEIAKKAKYKGITRSMAGIDHAVTLDGPKIFAIGNAPTALYRVIEHMNEDANLDVRGIIGVPVGFVGAEESKDYLWEQDIDSIIVKGRKGGSTIVVAIVNAILRKAIHDLKY